MKQLTVCAIALMLTLSTSANEINFVSNLSWKQIKEKAAKEKKMIFFDAYASWCGPCKYLEKNVYTDTKVAAYFNANYINVKLDMEDGEGLKLAQEFAITSYPTLLFFASNGEMVHKTIGALEPTEFIALGMQAKDPATQYFTLKQKAGKLGLNDHDFNYWAAMADKLDDEDKDAIIAALLATKPDILANEDLASTVLLHASVLTDKQMFYLHDNQLTIEKIMNWDAQRTKDLLYKKLFSHALTVYTRSNNNIDSFSNIVRKYNPLKENFAIKDLNLRLAVYGEKDYAKAMDLLLKNLNDTNNPTSLEDIFGWLIDYSSSFETAEFQKMNDELKQFKLRPSDIGKEYWLWIMQVICAEKNGDSPAAKSFAQKAYTHPNTSEIYKQRLKEVYSLTE